LKHIFGFCEDYDKIVYGLKHTLTLVRKSDDDAIFRAAAAVEAKCKNCARKTEIYNSVISDGKGRRSS